MISWFREGISFYETSDEAIIQNSCSYGKSGVLANIAQQTRSFFFFSGKLELLLRILRNIFLWRSFSWKIRAVLISIAQHFFEGFFIPVLIIFCPSWKIQSVLWYNISHILIALNNLTCSLYISWKKRTPFWQK